MKFSEKWTKFSRNLDESIESVYDICFNGDGSQLWVTCGKYIAIYQSNDGSLFKYLNGHNDLVKGLMNSGMNGKLIASFGLDKMVIIWTVNEKIDITSKYLHKDTINCMSFNINTYQLISCSSFEFIFWFPDQKNIQKFKVKNRILACSWSFDGQLFALGYSNGLISIRYKNGDEFRTIESPDGKLYPIIKVLWSQYGNNLTVIDSGSNSFCFSSQGDLIEKETISEYLKSNRNQMTIYNSFEITCLDYFQQCEYLLVCSTNRTCTLYTKNAIKLANVSNEQSSTILSCASHPKLSYFIIGCQNGQLIYSHIVFNTIHSLYMDKYASRENMTNITIQNVLNDTKVQIKCRAFIKKLAINNKLLAVQLHDRLIFYENVSPEKNCMLYKIKNKIAWNEESNLMLVLENYFIICKDSTLKCYDFNGIFQNEWILSDLIRYAKVFTDQIDDQNIFLGLKNGQVFRINLSKNQINLLVKISSSIKCLDLNINKTKIGIVEENQNYLHIFNIMNDDCELIYEESNIDCVSWNQKFNDMCCYSSKNTLTVKLNEILIYQENINGFVVSFIGSKAFCLNTTKLISVPIPLQQLIENSLKQNLVEQAYQLQCIDNGNIINEQIKLNIAFAAMKHFLFEISAKLFDEIKEYQHLQFLKDIQRKKDNDVFNNNILRGDISVYLGNDEEASEFYQKASYELIKLKKVYLEENIESKMNLIRQKANWALNNNNNELAVKLYNSIEDYEKSIEIMSQYKMIGSLIDISKDLDKTHKYYLLKIAKHLRKVEEWNAAIEIYQKISDTQAIFDTFIESSMWSKAYALVEIEPNLTEQYYINHAIYLIENKQYLEAQKDLINIGKLDEALEILKKLANYAIEEMRFNDAYYLYWILSRNYLSLAKECADNEIEMVEKFYEYSHLADIYYAYDTINEYLEQTFTTFLSDGIFNTARFLLNEIDGKPPKGILLFSKSIHNDNRFLFETHKNLNFSNIYFTLSKQANVLCAHNLERDLLNKIQNLRIPKRFLHEVEVSTLILKSKNFSDSDPEELLPLCYRCSNYNSFLLQRNNCLYCGHNFNYSFYSFELLPVIEFSLAEGISDEEAIKIIESNVCYEDSHKKVSQILTVSTKTEKNVQSCIKIDRNVLNLLDSTMILICKWPPPLKYQYYFNLLSDMEIVVCPICYKLILAEDYECSIIKNKRCPFCKCLTNTIENEVESTKVDFSLLVSDNNQKINGHPKYI